MLGLKGFICYALFMTRHQQLARINEHLDSLNDEALEGLLMLLDATKKSVDSESAVWLASAFDAAPRYDWGELEPDTLGVSLRFVEGKGWVSES